MVTPSDAVLIIETVIDLVAVDQCKDAAKDQRPVAWLLSMGFQVQKTVLLNPEITFRDQWTGWLVVVSRRRAECGATAHNTWGRVLL